jgi:hypothetical protein
VRYLSDDWILALDEAVRSDPDLRTAAAAAGADLVVQQTVTGTAEGDVVYRVQLRDGAARVLPGPDPDATVRLVADAGTAAAIARGDLAAQEAFMQGRLRIGGDVTALLDHRAVFTSVTDVAAAVRDRTEW